MAAMEHKVEMTAFRTQVTAIEGRLSTTECQAEGKAMLVQQALMVTGTWFKDRHRGLIQKVRLGCNLLLIGHLVSCLE